MSELIVYRDHRKLFCLPLDSQRISIGRSSTNDLILTGDPVSRNHAVINQKDSEFWLADMSTIGTFVDGQKIDRPIVLKDKSEIKIADWIIVFHKDSKVLEKQSKDRDTQITKLSKQAKRSIGDATKVLKVQPSGKMQAYRPTLFIQELGCEPRHYLLKKKCIVIGSSKEADVVIKDQFVSKFHVELKLSDYGFHISDLDSTNGTYVRNSKIKESYIQSEQEIQLGQTKISIKFEAVAQDNIEPFDENCFCGIYGRSNEMRLLFSRINLVAQTDMTVLIQGETGTGKEMVARAIHDLSSRQKNPYVVLNCGAISPNLIESELFGYEKGAFTGAEQRYLGAFEQANGGTIFLDEIGELDLGLQAKLLRVLEYQTLRRLGAQQEIKVDVRIVAATHRDLTKMVGQKKFREDLFYRLFVLPLRVPPLRERSQDIKLLAKSFVKKFSPKDIIDIDPSAIEKLKYHAWPGNVRELKNTILRAIAYRSGNNISEKDIEFISVPRDISIKQILPAKQDKPEGIEIKIEENDPNIGDKIKKDYERAKIVRMLEKTGWDKAKTAEKLGIGRSTLFRRIKEYDIEI